MVEILVATAVGALIVFGVAGVIATAIQASNQSGKIQTATALGRELSESVRVWSEADWSRVSALSKGSSNHYYLTAGSPYASSSGDETLSISTTTFTRYFYLENVERDSGGAIVLSGGTNDPSTYKLSVVVRWSTNASRTISTYLTRSANRVFHQTDWSGGPGQTSTVSAPTDQFTTSTGIAYASSTGQLMLNFGGSGGGGGGPGTNIDSSNRWAWNDIVGWIDHYITDTVYVTSADVKGYASSSALQIAFNCDSTPTPPVPSCSGSSGNWKVLNNGSGALSGWGWNDTFGWISFCGGLSSVDCPGAISYRVLINGSTGDFSGYAWNDIVGWISFNCSDQGICGTSNYKVNTSWRASALSGTLDSATLDTSATSGAQLNSVLWQGTQPVGTAVRFQFAKSNSSSGPWSYIGSDGTSGTYYSPSPNSSSWLSPSLFGGSRFYRYRVFLESDAAQTLTPTIDDIAVNWSP